MCLQIPQYLLQSKVLTKNINVLYEDNLALSKFQQTFMTRGLSQHKDAILPVQGFPL